MSLYELVYSVIEVLETVAVAMVGIADAVFDMILQDYLGGVIERRAHRRKLDEHISAVPPLLDHALHGLKVPDGAGKAVHDGVHYCLANGLMEGVSDTLFAPNASMTRAMVWAILARLDGETVTGANWAETARAWAMENGVSDGTDPMGAVTREQFATMLWRYAVAKGYDVSIGESTNILSYADFASISEYAIPAMQWACGSGIVTGVTDSTLAPQGTATRAQCAAMLMRFVEGEF